MSATKLETVKLNELVKGDRVVVTYTHSDYIHVRIVGTFDELTPVFCKLVNVKRTAKHDNWTDSFERPRLNIHNADNQYLVRRYPRKAA